VKYLIFVISILILTACKKAEDRACFKNAGEATSLTIALPDFDKLKVGGHIEVVLIQDTENKAVIHGRKNLIKHIEAEINDQGFLELTNKNKCNFLRSYPKNKIKVELHFVTLNELRFEGTDDLTCQSTIHTNHFKMVIQDGGATVYLDLDCTYFEAVQGHGYGNFVAKGSCKNLHAKITSNGYCDISQMQVENSLVFISSTPVSSFINLDGSNATVEINGSGNVKYIGYPASLQLNRYGKGDLINFN